MALHPSLLTSAALPAVGPDAALIGACNDFAAAQIALEGRVTHDEGLALDAATVAAFEGMLAGHATTPEGFRARARALAVYQEDDASMHDPWPDAMLDALLRDMLGLPDDDVELIALCADFEKNERSIREIYDNPARKFSDENAAAVALPLEKRIPAMLDKMAALRATTTAGIHARARVLAAANSDAAFSVDDADTVFGRLYEYLCRDALALGMERKAA